MLKISEFSIQIATIQHYIIIFPLTQVPHRAIIQPVMTMYKLSKTINLDQMFKQTTGLAGQFNLVECLRLAPLLLSTDAVVDFSLQFMQDDASRRVVKITIDCGLMLECQRCMQPMCYQVAIENLLVVVASEKEAENCPEEYEPLLLTTNEVILGDLLEDELLLKLPLVAKHDEAECRVKIPEFRQDDTPKSSKKPFAALDTLMRSDKNGSSKES
jgi:uncharacterized protein